MNPTTRRHFLTNSTLTTAALLAAPQLPAARKPTGKIAAIITEYRNTSHADVIVGRLIKGLRLDLEPHAPTLRLGAMYIDQTPAADLSRPLSKRFGIPIAKTVRDAILDADGNLAVDGVVLIGEHGNYPSNERGQHLYPRRRFFEETVAAFEQAGEVVPVFNDKHLAPLWTDAKWIYDKAKELKIPFMAGSSLPLTWRRPWLDIPLGTPVDEALSVGYGGLEAYGFHALETLQCMVERRQGGESGVAAVQCLEGDAVWQAMADGRFSRDLLAAALSRNTPPVDADFESRCKNPTAYLIEYTDGFRATCLILNGVARQFLFAAKLTGDTGFASTQFWLQEPVYGHFSYLTNAIAHFIQSGQAPYPVERTLLTTGILATAMDSRFENHRRIATPDLKNLTYTATDHHLGAYSHPDAENTRDGGWIQLFNGVNLDGWRENRFQHKPEWKIIDGILTGHGGQGYLATLEQFDDFELFAEARITDTGNRRGNSGIYFRCAPHLDRKQEFPPGYEAQLDNGDGNNPNGSIYSLNIPGSKAPKTDTEDGDWITMRIRAVGNHLQTWINGDPAADCRDPQNRHTSGAILLQMHHLTGKVEFREVRIRRLPVANPQK